MEGFDDGRADLAGADEEDPHGRVAYFGQHGVAHTRRLPLPDAARPARRWCALAWSRSPPSPGPRSAPRAHSARSSSRGLRAPVQVTRAAASRAASTSSSSPERAASARGNLRKVFLDIRDRVQYGGEQGLLGLAFDPSTRPTIASTWTTRSKRATHASHDYRANGARALPGDPRDPPGRPTSRTGTTTAVTSRSGQTAASTSAWATAGRAAIRRTGRRTCSRCSGRCCARRLEARARRRSIVGLGLRNPWRFSFDRRNGRPVHRRRGPGRDRRGGLHAARQPGSRELRLERYEGSQRFEDEGSPGPGKLVFPVAEYSPTAAAAASPAASSTADRRGRPSAAATSSATTAAGRSGASSWLKGATDVRVEPFRVQSLTSFGENTAGELFATSTRASTG